MKELDKAYEYIDKAYQIINEKGIDFPLTNQLDFAVMMRTLPTTKNIQHHV